MRSETDAVGAVPAMRAPGTGTREERGAVSER
ncbi:hypothetical protein FHS22_001850 [Planomonospora venezuelensis]|uniref:Uncharacterized protein n=1 Tax=Planomonospora venezuelensis TaxID=1999 RepID=A0A841CZ70_PLAVE|nr:hypothetical protein [Planomonospora venezuelensis]